MAALFAHPRTQAAASTQFVQDVEAGLGATPKTIPAQYFYDDVGSALFEAITALPEYGLTRADARLVRRHAAEIVGFDDTHLHIVELGSGSGLKTRGLLETAVARLGQVRYSPIDVSAFALELCRKSFANIPGVQIELQNETYVNGLRQAMSHRRPGERALVLFLGSTIGNFDAGPATQLLTDVRRYLKTGDVLLLGTDLVKPEALLNLAYDDPAGVTAAFNRNLLARINRELGGNFDVRSFNHEARWNAADSRVEMHLRATRAQSVRIDAIERTFHFAADETIWTESSYKFTPERVRQLARASGFHCEAQWIDDQWPFAENLLRAG